MRALLLAAALAAAAAAFPLNLTSKTNYTFTKSANPLADVRDALQAKLPDAGGKLGVVRDALVEPFANKTLPNPYNDVVSSGGLQKCVDVGGYKQLLQTGQLVNGEYYGVQRTIDGTGGGFIYQAVNPANPYALPSNGAGVTPYGASKGVRAAIQYTANPDIPTIHYRDGKHYMVVHRESYPGGMDMVQVDADKVTGELVAVNTTNVDFAASPYFGLWFPCSGSVFPYGDTHLGSEEFEPDCRYGLDTNGGDRSSSRGAFGIAQQAAQWSYYQDASPTVGGVNYSPGLTLASPPVAGVIDVIVNSPSTTPPTLVWPPGAQEKFVCYAYGWTPEVSPSPKLAALGGPASKNTKWYTLGRFSHEVSVLLWDGKTVLMGDDKTAGVLGMFVADVKGDLSSGTLYAAALSNEVDGAANGQGTEWDVSWVRLGHGKQGKLKSMVTSIQFSDMFDTAPVIGTGLAASCPTGYTLVVTYGSGSSAYWAAGTTSATARFLECLAIKPGMQDAAAFFETRRTAGVLGATTEFEKLEGVTYNPKTKKAYAAMARFGNAATAGTSQTPPYQTDLVGADNMRLPPNRCGGVLELDLSPIDWRPVKARIVLAGTPIGPWDPAGRKGRCDMDSIAGPDNLHMIPGTSTLLIAEDVDPDEGHPNSMLWAYDTLRPEAGLVRIGVAPYDSEFTGIYTSFVGKFAYLMYTLQHPATGLPDSVSLTYPAPGKVSYLGPLPSSTLTGVPVAALQEGALDAATGKLLSAEHIVWQETKLLQQVTFDGVAYTPPDYTGTPQNNYEEPFNTIPATTSAGICGTKVV